MTTPGLAGGFSSRQRAERIHESSPSRKGGRPGYLSISPAPSLSSLPLGGLRLEGADVGVAEVEVLLQFAGLLQESVRDLDVFREHRSMLLAESGLEALQEFLPLPIRETQGQLAASGQEAEHMTVPGGVGHAGPLSLDARNGGHQLFVEVELVSGCSVCLFAHGS